MESTEKIEREYVIPLRRKISKTERYRRAKKAIKVIKEFIIKNMKIRDKDLKKVKIDPYLNEYVWFKGIKNPPAKIKVKAMKEGEIVKVELFEIPEKLRFKRERELKKEEKEKSKKKEKEEKKEEEKEGETAKDQEEKKEDAAKKLEAQKEKYSEISKDIAKKSKHETRIKKKEPKRPQRVALAK